MDSLAVLYRLSRLMNSPDDLLIVTTSRLGDSMDVSQQTVSRYLKTLESEGFITRRSTGFGQEITLTQTAIKSLKEMHKGLETLMSKKPLFIEGIVISGLEEGAYYIQQYREKIEKDLGFEPFPGTMNVEFDASTNLERYATVTISGFKMGDRTFGEIKLFPVKLQRDKKKVGCYAILPKRTHHEGILELIGRDNLRKKLSLKDGDVVKIEITI